MLVLVGLGNPGEKYAKHRHNVGFMAVDAVAEAYGFGPARSKFQGELREGYIEGSGGRVKALTLKPTTFMNESGRAVQELAKFYKITPEDVIVFYDELDLAAGKIKMKTGGGAAGHNGIKSIDAHLGNNFKRVRIGIGHPGDKSKVSGYVLGNFSKADNEWLEPLLSALTAAIPKLTESDAKFLSDVALKLAPKKDQKPKSSQPDKMPRKIDAPSDSQKNTSTRGPLAEALQKLLGQKD